MRSQCRKLALLEQRSVPGKCQACGTGTPNLDGCPYVTVAEPYRPHYMESPQQKDPHWKKIETRPEDLSEQWERVDGPKGRVVIVHFPIEAFRMGPRFALSVVRGDSAALHNLDGAQDFVDAADIAERWGY